MALLAAVGANSGEKDFVDIQQFIEKQQQLLPAYMIEGNHGKSEEKFISSHSAIPPEIVAELKGVCSESILTCQDEPADKELFLQEIPPDIPLLSIEAHKRDLADREASSIYKSQVLVGMRYRHNRVHYLHQELSSKSDQKNPMALPQVLITINTLRPFEKGKGHCAQAEQEIQVVGCQKLSDLRDALRCTTESVFLGDYSEMPNEQPKIRAKDLYKSGYFFIEDVFYNDMRDPENDDYSKLVIDWANKEKLESYRAARMEDTCFEDLKIRLSHPYVYCHQGSCEHILMFSDIRLLHPEDCQSLEEYPIETSYLSQKSVICRVCGMYRARWITKNSTHTPEEPCFFCDTCFQAFHYDVAGNKLFDFEAYHYPGSTDKPS